MDKEIDRELDEFTGKLLKDLPLESTSFDFTTQVMSRVGVFSESDITVYKPLISKKTWLVLAILVIGVFAYFIFGNVQVENPVASSMQLDLLPKLELFTLPNYEISNVFLYGVVGFTFFMGVQIFLLKDYFNRRFNALI